MQVCIKTVVSGVQRGSWKDRHLHRHRLHDGGSGGRGQGGHLWIRGHTPQTEMSNGSSRGNMSDMETVHMCSITLRNEEQDLTPAIHPSYIFSHRLSTS